MASIHQVISYIRYWLTEESEHSLHAPFVYEFYKHVVNKKNKKPIFPDIEKIRTDFGKSTTTIKITDFGSGSRVAKSNERKIADIANKGLSKRKYCELYERLISYFNYNHVIELGTSLGINTLYLAKNKAVEVTTFEGASSLAAIASAVFEGNNKKNIQLIEGNINETLPVFLKKQQQIDLAFFDANHKYVPTLEYFELLLSHIHNDTCFIFDDIHLNKEMEKAWNVIQKHYLVTVSIDLFQIGIVFFNPDVRKQHYILSF